MKVWIALFRGINVGGHHALSMNELKALLESHGCSDVQTYIQSGNVVFRSALSEPRSVEQRLADAVVRGHGFEARVLVLTRRELEEAAAGNPFPRADQDPKSVHLFFLATAPKKPDTSELEAIRGSTERFALRGRVFYLYTPDGFGRSKLAERAELLLGVPATARNWRTVTRLIEMAESYQ